MSDVITREHSGKASALLNKVQKFGTDRLVLHTRCTNCKVRSRTGWHQLIRIVHKVWVCRTCQVQMNAIIGFPKPQVACSIHAGGASASASACA